MPVVVVVVVTALVGGFIGIIGVLEVNASKCVVAVFVSLRQADTETRKKREVNETPEHTIESKNAKIIPYYLVN